MDFFNINGFLLWYFWARNITRVLMSDVDGCGPDHVQVNCSWKWIVQRGAPIVNCRGTWNSQFFSPFWFKTAHSEPHAVILKENWPSYATWVFTKIVEPSNIGLACFHQFGNCKLEFFEKTCKVYYVLIHGKPASRMLFCKVLFSKLKISF